VQVIGPTLGRMEVSTWRTAAGDLDILADLPDRTGVHRSYEEVMERAEALDLNGIVVPVAALDDIIASKQWADRPKDRDALPELLRLRESPERG